MEEANLLNYTSQRYMRAFMQAEFDPEIQKE